jgi:chorismate synthase
VVRGYLKPISTLRRPLESVRFDTREATSASYERSDICVVPAAGVAAEAMVALTSPAWRSRSSAATQCSKCNEISRLHRTDTELLENGLSRNGAVRKSQ